MKELHKRWGMVGYALGLAALIGLALGLFGVAAARSWGWYPLILGVVLLISGGALLYAVATSRRRSLDHDRTERDPIMDSGISVEKERDYVRRYRRKGRSFAPHRRLR